MTSTAPVSIGLGAKAGTVVIHFGGKDVTLTAAHAENLARSLAVFADLAKEPLPQKAS